MGCCSWLVHDGECIATATSGIGYGSVRTEVGGSYCFFLAPRLSNPPNVAIAMYLTLCAMLLRCSAMCLLGGGCDVRWIASGMCDPVLISTDILYDVCRDISGAVQCSHLA